MLYNIWKTLSVILSNALSQKQLVLEASNLVSLKETAEFQQYGTDFEKAKRQLEEWVNDELETSEEGVRFLKEVPNNSRRAALSFKKTK